MIPFAKHPWPAGALIDGFRIDTLVHRGGMAFLYRVHGEGAAVPPFPLLMKVPELGTGLSSEGILSFETERAILPTLAGPHVPRFVAAGDVSRAPYIVMEAIEAASLAAIATAELPLDRVVALGASIADAVGDVHQQAVIHLDLKPDNLLIRPDDSAVLIDFGLAHCARVPDLLAEEQRFAAGSVPYLAPEQLRGMRSDPRADLFALGVVLYELATGELPFGVPTTPAGVRDRIWLDPAPPRAHRAEVFPWLQEIILHCLEPDPRHRYQSAEAIAFDLRHPDQIELGERAAKTRRLGWFEQFERWRRARGELDEVRSERADQERGKESIVMVAVDTAHLDDERHPAILTTVANVLGFAPNSRVICVAVVPPTWPGASDLSVVDHHVRLREWVSSLGLPRERLTLHVLESTDPAHALLEFARTNSTDLIVLGAPAPASAALAWWRSVASSVAAQAHCSVYLVRAAMSSS